MLTHWAPTMLKLPQNVWVLTRSTLVLQKGNYDAFCSVSDSRCFFSFTFPVCLQELSPRPLQVLRTWESSLRLTTVWKGPSLTHYVLSRSQSSTWQCCRWIARRSLGATVVTCVSSRERMSRVLSRREIRAQTRHTRFGLGYLPSTPEPKKHPQSRMPSTRKAPTMI